MAKKTSPMWFALTAMLAVAVGLAMTPLTRGQTPAQQQQDQSQSQNSQQAVTATGCLQKAASGSGYQLTDSSTNKTYDLMASSSDVDLSAHVGHTVTVTGTPSSASASSSASGSATNPGSTSNPGSQASGQPSGMSSTGNQQLSVSNVKMVSSTCQQK